MQENWCKRPLMQASSLASEVGEARAQARTLAPAVGNIWVLFGFRQNLVSANFTILPINLTFVMKKRIPAIILVACLVALISSVSAQNKRIYTSPEPEWRLPVEIDNRSPAAKDISNGYYISLLEVQTHVELKTTYTHKIQKIVSETGVQNVSEVSVDFNPSYEKLTFHKIVIRRNGQQLNQLNIKKFKILQNESDLSRFIYNESYQAYLVLENTQKGDEIEIAYSLAGRNPIFQGKFFDDFYFYSRSPIVNLYRNIIFSPKRKLYFKHFNNSPAPTIGTRNGLITHEWKANQTKSNQSEDYEPSWLDVIPHVQISEYRTWKEVVEWSQTLHRFPSRLPTTLMKKIEAWKQLSGSDKAMFAELATRFAQDEIRYMGIETGEHSHRPHSPEQVFAQRFGDCKDKSILLCSILRANDIDANPALINTYYGEKITQFMPSPIVFNHEVVMAEIDDKYYWIDPTISLQRGVLTDNFFPNYGKALLIKPMESEPRSISETPAGKMVVNEIYRIGKIGEDASLEVQSSYSRNFADDTRSQFASSSISDLEKGYLDFYTNNNKDFHLELLDSLRYEDNPKENSFRSFEKYSIKEIWKRPDSSKRIYTAAFFGQILSDQLRSLPDKKRKNPISLNHPYNLDYTIKIFLPEAWTASNEEKTINRDSYKFSYQAKYDALENAITLHYTYETLKDFIPAIKSSEFVRDVNEMNKHLTYSLSWNIDLVEQTGKTNWWMLLFGMVVSAVFTYVGIQLYKLSLPVMASDIYYVRPIGGWLVLALIGMCLTPPKILLLIYQNKFLDLGNWQAVSLLETGQRTLYQVVWIFELMANIFLICYAVLIIILFVNRRNTLPKFIIGFYASNLFIQVFDLVFINQLHSITEKDMGDSGKQLLQSLVFAAIWIPYFIISVRVKKTFVYPYSDTYIQQDSVIEEK